MANESEADVFFVEITPTMIEAGVAVLMKEFSGPSEHPRMDYDRTAKAVLEAMIARCEPSNLVYRPRKGDDR
jgi:hypothetical protein